MQVHLCCPKLHKVDHMSGGQKEGSSTFARKNKNVDRQDWYVTNSNIKILNVKINRSQKIKWQEQVLSRVELN